MAGCEISPDAATVPEPAKSSRSTVEWAIAGPEAAATLPATPPASKKINQLAARTYLAIAGDNVFRFTPSDVPEGRANSTLMWEDGIRALVPVWRDDAGNAGLAVATRAAFSAAGGTVLAGGEVFPCALTDRTSFLLELEELPRDVLAPSSSARLVDHNRVRLLSWSDGSPG